MVEPLFTVTSALAEIMVIPLVAIRLLKVRAFCDRLVTLIAPFCAVKAALVVKTPVAAGTVRVIPVLLVMLSVFGFTGPSSGTEAIFVLTFKLVLVPKIEPVVDTPN